MLHDGAHFSISRRPWVNDLCVFLGSAHTSPTMWFHQHDIGEPQYPNCPSLDQDLQHFRHDRGALQRERGWRCLKEQTQMN